jgi:diacylglycerol kinase (ATP)
MLVTQRPRPIATYHNAFLIYNPNAGKLNRRRGDILQRTIGVLENAGHRVHAVPTTGPRMAATLARECIEKGADLILAAGGDGTINEVANGMVGQQTPLAILPGGTANVLANELGLKADMPAVAARIGTLTPSRIGVGLLENEHESRHFVLMAGAGFDALVVYNIDTKLKSTLGKVAYWVSGFGQFGRKLPEFTAHIDGESVRCSFALVSRVRNYGGDLCIARDACLLNETFEVVLFQGRNTAPYVKYLAGIVSGRLANMKGVRIVRTRSLELDCPRDPRIYVHVDGETAGRLPAKLTMLPDTLTILLPDEYGPPRTNG